MEEVVGAEIVDDGLLDLSGPASLAERGSHQAGKRHTQKKKLARFYGGRHFRGKLQCVAEINFVASDAFFQTSDSWEGTQVVRGIVGIIGRRRLRCLNRIDRLGYFAHIRCYSSRCKRPTEDWQTGWLADPSTRTIQKPNIVLTPSNRKPARSSSYLTNLAKFLASRVAKCLQSARV